jgi:hypothetical protein
MLSILTSSEMSALLTLVEEAARSTQEGVKHFVEPAPDTLRRATSKRHHIVFGRRGSGKSSLLRKAAADLTIDRRPIAYVNLEVFKGHSYPDVLLSVLIATLTEVKKWMDSAAIHPATRTSFWTRLFGTAPKRASLNRKAASELSTTIANQIEALNKELHRTDEADLTVKSGSEENEKDSYALKSKMGISGASISGEAALEVTQKVKEEVEDEVQEVKGRFLTPAHHGLSTPFQAYCRSVGR